MASRIATETPTTHTTSVIGDVFDRDHRYANWRPTGSGDWLLIYTAAGSGLIGLGQRTLRTRLGDLLLYEPGAAQDYSTAPETGRWRLQWSHFIPRITWREWLSWPLIAPKTRLVHLSAAWRRPCTEALRRMVHATRRPGPIQTELAYAALEEAILIGRAASADRQVAALDRRIQRAVSLLIDNFKSPFHLPRLARDCGLSVSRFSLLFHRQVGKTPRQFVEEQRLAHAAHLLRRTALSVGEIAAECGFNEAFYFTNRFRRRQGLSPSAFRQRARHSQPVPLVNR